MISKSQSAAIADVRNALKQIWGYDDFRPPQGEIVRSLMEGKDALIVLPTGGGKSICFQLPALLKNGLTLVVSPLVALMENQVQELRDRHLPATLIHSQISPQKRRQTLKQLEENHLRLLYLSPETLLSKPVWNVISKPDISINGLILDEAHCLVQWGDTFRPAYRRLGAVRPALLKNKPPGSKIAIAAFTATADPRAQKTIQTVLQLQKPQPFLLSPYRKNLHVKIQRVWTPNGRQKHLLKFIGDRKGKAGLVYVRTRRDSEELADWLREEGYKTAPYHAGLDSEQRRGIEADWLGGKLTFVVCTSAFGMGINKPDVRWVAHFQPPLLLSEYIQEIGRGGRDGKPAEALTLLCEPTGFLYPEDKQRQQFLQDNLRQQTQQAKRLINKLPKRGNLDTVSAQFPQSAIALSLLHAARKLTWIDPFNYKITENNLSFSEDSNAIAIRQMNQYFGTRDCRWKFLLEAFGFEKEAKSFRCGHCDNCDRHQ
ncbi:RecQ family ATP-dependent DNA helicase [Lyngbya sp. CCY1209]|uniref:RecQ family ATP-dependent DNA helicase n=1 Tax=Lyngbya sp. CCY1209 TaxID=2886103 RepID=UPI002D207021|nr:RecQ family ATP-dependent DNA helicase [Lyngbya sp. CCY1209]MEB3886170.1 RecQ family ATP-dependent DNA helicase [Lyngbya sp. CCY1209]